MHGLICKPIETFIRVNHGPKVWDTVRTASGLEADGFESMRLYSDTLLARVVLASSHMLGRTRSDLLEDVGTWVCTYPPLDPVRRLVRFSGRTYEELIWSMEELRDRGHLAVPDLDLPACTVAQMGDGAFRISMSWVMGGAASVMTGMLRAMADDYGTLALIDREPMREIAGGGWVGALTVRLIDTNFAEPREFEICRDG